MHEKDFTLLRILKGRLVYRRGDLLLFIHEPSQDLMFESIEIRKAKNGVIVTLRNDEEEDQEYVYDADRKALKFIKDLLEVKPTKERAPA